MPGSKTMSGVVLTAHGGPDVLQWSDHLAMPEPGPGEALIRVLAAGVNATDINTRQGWYARDDQPDGGGWGGAIAFPRIQGSDLCGRVLRHGTGTSTPPLGARVICPTNQAEPTSDNPLAFRAIGSEYDGAFAQYCVVPAKHLFDVSDCPLSDIELGAVPCAYGTAFNLLSRAGVTQDERVLVTGASGGVGYAAVQLARLLGAEVVAQCSRHKAAALVPTGAQWLDREAEPPNNNFDVVIDVLGGPGTARRLQSLRPGGRYATSGAIAGPQALVDLRTIYLNDLTLLGCTHQPHATFAHLVKLLCSGQLRPLVSATYPLEEIAQAQAVFESKQLPGKIVLLPPPPL